MFWNVFEKQEPWLHATLFSTLVMQLFCKIWISNVLGGYKKKKFK